MIFTDAHSSSAVCTPTRYGLLTGQRPLTHGVFLNDVPLDTNATTLPKVLKAAGYYAHCTALDDCLGELLQALDSTGLAADTILLFSADHADIARALQRADSKHRGGP